MGGRGGEWEREGRWEGEVESGRGRDGGRER